MQHENYIQSVGFEKSLSRNVSPYTGFLGSLSVGFLCGGISLCLHRHCGPDWSRSSLGQRTDNFQSLPNSGKSSLANALLGCDPRGDNDCMFGVCGGLDSCTKNTTIGTGQWLGDADSFTVRTMIKLYNQK